MVEAGLKQNLCFSGTALLITGRFELEHFHQERKQLVYSLILVTQTLFFLNGSNYSMAILLLEVSLASVFYLVCCKYLLKGHKDPGL